MADASDEFSLRLPLLARWDRVEHARQVVSSTLGALCVEQGVCDEVVLAASELLENAVKYGAWEGSDDERIALRLSGRRGELVVSVENPASPPAVSAVSDTIEWLRGLRSPSEGYLQRLQVLYENPGGPRPSLGLARVLHQGRCTIRHSVRDGRFLTIEARFSLGQEAPR